MSFVIDLLLLSTQLCVYYCRRKRTNEGGGTGKVFKQANLLYNNMYEEGTSSCKIMYFVKFEVQYYTSWKKCKWWKVSIVDYFLFYKLLLFLCFVSLNIETPGDQIVRKLTFERIEELKKSIRNDQLTFK